MAATASASAALPELAVDPDLEDSNVSSPLTEVDDKDDNEEDINHMQIDGEDGDNSSISGDENPTGDNEDNDQSDSASVLSDAGSDGNSDGNDTEAETERLYDTPRNRRQRDVIVDQYNQGQVFEHTPSKLRRTTDPEERDRDQDGDDDDDADHESVSGDEASVASSADDADETPSKPVFKSQRLLDSAPSSDSLDRKRKRSPVADNSETDQPQKKRTGSVGAASVDQALDDDDKATGNVDSAIQSEAEEEEVSSNNRDTGTEGEMQEQASRSSRSSRKSTRNSLRSKEVAKEEEDDTGVDAATETAGDATDQHEDDAEVDAEGEESEAAAKNLEESMHNILGLRDLVQNVNQVPGERKKAAFKEWSHIEEMFGIFRDR